VSPLRGENPIFGPLSKNNTVQGRRPAGNQTQVFVIWLRMSRKR